MSTRYTAQQIAHWILAYNEYIKAEKDADSISNLKMQKLLYYSQCAHLAIYDKPLFDDPIEAWLHGPVVPSVYHEYKGCGANGIEPEGFDMREIDSETRGFLEMVYDGFAQYSAWKLREMTHEETPWRETPQNGTIAHRAMQKYFTENYID